jgi:hypothetical protein
MPIFLQPVDLPERCYLEEVLFWIAFQRLPVAEYWDDGMDIREREDMGYEPELPISGLTDLEAERAGIPVDPDWLALIGDKAHLSSQHYDQYLAKNDLDPELRRIWTTERDAAVAFEREREIWEETYYQPTIEYACSKIYIALRDGNLAAKGRLLPAFDKDEAFAALEAKGEGILDLVPTHIPKSFWTLKGIQFETSSAQSLTDHYCHISFLTEDVLRVFPGEREEVFGVHRLGDAFIIGDQTPSVRPSVHRGRGRPPYPWDRLHLEIAELIQRNELPVKKEAAIEYFQSWFARELGTRPSRSAIGEKLTPYYERFVRRGRQKIG